MTGKWHLGWDKDSYGDNLHGPLGHGFEEFYGLPFTFVDGFERYCKCCYAIWSIDHFYPRAQWYT